MKVAAEEGLKWVSQHLGRQLELDPLLALMILAVLTTVSGFVGRMIWAGLVKFRDRWLYGHWKVVVSGGNSGLHWHAPLDQEIIRHLLRGNYFAFKRDLGTVISGEGVLNFSFGVPVRDLVVGCPPEAPGLMIDRVKRTITIDFAKARAVAKVQPNTTGSATRT